MKIGITIPHASVNYYGGVNVLCRMWQQGLSKLGHQVDLLTPWDDFDYPEYDFFVIVGHGGSLRDYVKLFKKFEKAKILNVPVLDPNIITLRKFKFKCKYYGSELLRYHTPYFDYYRCRHDFSMFFVFSDYEKKYVVEGMGIPESIVKVLPVPMRFTERPSFNLSEKKDVCLHVSQLQREGKNVARLIQAAKKFGFQLNLAGTLEGDAGKEWFDNLTEGAENIRYLGRLNDDELIEEYRKSKVFALPSLVEGAGMVAMEAATYGCEICLTSLGGPKEYYDGRAVLVDPYDVDSIGRGVLEAMNNKNAQPELSDYMYENYSVESIMKRLVSYLKEIK